MDDGDGSGDDDGEEVEGDRETIVVVHCHRPSEIGDGDVVDDGGVDDRESRGKSGSDHYEDGGIRGSWRCEEREEI